MFYQELIEALNKQNVHYLIIGGFAVNYYGYSRMTEDLDILFEPTPKNGMHLVDALKELKFDLEPYTDHDFASPTHLRLGNPPNTIDLINETKGINLSTAFKNAHQGEILGLEVPIISLSDLIDYKIALNTYKDLADAEMLKEIQKSGQ